MANQPLSDRAKSIILEMQKNEITEYHIYNAVAKRVKDAHNRETLLRIAEEEKRHYNIWRGYTGEAPTPKKWKVRWYSLLAKVLGFTFALKLMESGESGAQRTYDDLSKEVPESTAILHEEEKHEQELLGILDEERLQYVGSMVLGLNDALVELTGTLAGLTFAMQNTRLIALSGLITGISATLSMASSEFLAARSEGRSDALKSCIYTGIAYLITVALLITPYLVLPESGFVTALIIMVVTVVAIIAAFNYYIAVAKGVGFKKRFFEMAAISLGVAVFSFVIGLFVKQVLGIDV
ncbi:MAG: rubrerythrin family protein [Clostridiales bacterium]|nr:rubrerythrin family protein [Clostridiales bacterium]